MKKVFCVLMMILIGLAVSAQRYEVPTSGPVSEFKRHYTYSIEGGFVNGQPRQYIAGNETDWLMNSKVVKGNAAYSGLFSIGKAVELSNSEPNVILTDFVITPGSTYQYAAGTGLYLPTGPTGFGYPYLGIYERGTGQIIKLVYFNLLYNDCPHDIPRYTIPTRVKYSRDADAFYISGIMTDRTFVGMNIMNPYLHSKGFILKVDASSLQTTVITFSPDQIADPKCYHCGL